MQTPLGISRSVPVLGGRPLSSTAPREELIALAAVDHTSAVRKVAADSLIKYRHELPNLDRLTALLATDANPGVRDRMAFLARAGQLRGSLD